MRFEDIEAALVRARKHLQDAADTETFSDMRLQLEHAKSATSSALKGIEAQIKGARGDLTILPRAPRG